MTAPIRALFRWSVTGVLVVAGFVLAGAAQASQAPPYTDLASKGSITLCDGAGNRVTSGGIDDKPFVLRAASTVGAPAPFDGAGRTAILTAYQPNKTVYPDQWHGDTLTATSQYTDVAHPMAVATPLDFSLRDYLKEFPARWDGYVQLRMFFGAKGKGVDTDVYPTTDLKVTGTTWTVVRGGTGDCKTGKAVSNEVAIAHVPGASATPTSSRAATGSPSPSTSAVASAGASSGSGQVQAAGAGSTGDRGGSSGPPSWVAAVVALVLLAAAGLLIASRRGTQQRGSPGH